MTTCTDIQQSMSDCDQEEVLSNTEYMKQECRGNSKENKKRKRTK